MPTLATRTGAVGLLEAPNSNPSKHLLAVFLPAAAALRPLHDAHMRRRRVEQRPIGAGADVPFTPRRSVIVGGKPPSGRDMLEHIWPEGGLKRGDDLAYDELCNTLYRNGVASVRNEDALRDVWAAICRSHRSAGAIGKHASTVSFEEWISAIENLELSGEGRHESPTRHGATPDPALLA